MAHIDNLQSFASGGINNDDAPEFLSPNDYLSAFNARNNGSTDQEAGYVTNPESNSLISGTRAAGINKGIGGKSFEDVRQVVMFVYNSGGFHQIVTYNADTQTQDTIYTDKTDSGGIPLLTLDPQYYVNCILINGTYLLWADGTSEVGYTNLKTLESGQYGTVLAEDLSLIKPQNLAPIIGVYANDTGKASNFVKGKLFQFTSQYINTDFNYSTWGTWSKRIIPPQEATPTEGTDVSSNNCIVVSVNIGSIRATQLNIACRYSEFDFNIIKTVDRSYIVALPETDIDILNQIFESYDPATNLYSFVFYNQSLTIPVPPTETDQFVDYIWPATGIEKINGNIAAIADLKVGYDRPATSVSLSSTGYDPNLTIPNDTPVLPLTVAVIYAGGEGSGSNKPRRRMQVKYTGIPHTGDVLKITTNSASDATNTHSYSYTVPAGQDGSLFSVVSSFSGILSGAVTTSGSGYIITFYEDPQPHRRIQLASVTLFDAGAAVSKSIHALLDNSSYQFALSYYDKWGRQFPLETDNTFIVTTPSFAQMNGLTAKMSWLINTAIAPVGAVSYQWLITKNTTVINLLDVMGNLLDYKGTWDAKNNSPSLAVNAGTMGDTYQITTPNDQSDTTHLVNLGNGNENFKTGDYVSYNGKSWDIIPKSFADLTSTSNVLAMKINPLNIFNERYANNGVNTILNYDFTIGDRCTLHYYFTPGSFGAKTYLNTPCIDVDVYGYDPTTYLVKIQKSSSINPATLLGKDIFLRLYTPNTQNAGSEAETENTTVWFEIGERFTITNGIHDTLSGSITDGDVYFKTRSYNGGIDPNIVYDVLATDFNFSDFYVSNFTSYGRSRAFYDILEKTEQKASIIYSQNYILGSKKNGLNRFYAENLYGDSDGQTSSSYGAIGVLWQRGDRLEVGQELRWGSIPVNRSILEDQAQQQQYAISQKLLNNITYSQTSNVGIGLAKESFCFKDNNGYFVDPNRSEPFRYGLDGIHSISDKISKYFKATIQLAYAQKKKLVMYYNMFYDEVMLCIQTDGGVLTLFPFNDSTWDAFEDYTIVPGDITGLTGGPHATVVNNGDGTATFTPELNYVGNNSGTMTFNTGTGSITKNICITFTPGSSEIDVFFFTPLINQPGTTVVVSNSITINGNTAPAPVSIVGGQYSVNGAAFTSSPGFLNDGDTVRVNVLTSGIELTAASSALTVSGYTATFTATTGVAVVNPFTFVDVTNATLTTTYTSNSITVTGNGLVAPISVVGGSYSINGGAFVTTAGTIANGSTVRVRGTSSGSPSTGADVTLSIDGQSDTYTITTGSAAVNPFSFTDVTNATLSTNYISNSITVSGNTLPAPISVSGGSYSVNGGAFVTSAGSVNAGDTVRVQQTSSGSGVTAVNTILNIDGQSDTYTVTTGTIAVGAFGFTPENEAQPSTLYTSNTVSPTGNTIPSPISITGGQYSINGGAFTGSAGTFNVGDNVTVRQTSSATVPTTATTVNLTIGGVTGSYVVTTYHVLTLNLHVVEPSSPYSDGNLQVKNNSIIVSTLNGNGDQTFIVQSRLPLSAEAFSELPSTGAGPLKTLDVKIGGVSVSGYPQTDDNNPGDPSILWTGTGADNAVYDFYVTASNTATLPPDATGILQIDILGPSTLELCAYVSTLGLAPSQMPVYQTTNNFYPNTGIPVEAMYALASDMRPSNDPKFRFQFNVAALLSQYPSATTFQFIVRGRDVTAGNINGSYSLKGADAGKMVMNGSPGTYLPATSGATTIGNVAFTGKPVTNGADGTYGVAVGNVVLTFTYTVSTKTMVLT